MVDIKELAEVSRKIRRDILVMLAEAGSGHSGGSLSATEIMVSLYWDILKHDPKNPDWEERDWFVLSKGHACPVLYAVVVLGLDDHHAVLLDKAGNGRGDLDLPDVRVTAEEILDLDLKCETLADLVRLRGPPVDHPVLIDGSYREALGGLTGDAGARHVLDEAGDAVSELELPDDGFLVDVDEPEDYEAVRNGIAPR